MQYRPLGRTGARVSTLGLGGESALYRHSEKAVRIIRKALDLGINYFDTAPSYQESELNYGEVLPAFRKEMFMATKVSHRYYSAAWRQFERSLKRLKVDRVDLLQIHHLDFPEEVDALSAPMGALRMVHEAKAQGLTRFVGVTGHNDPDVLLRMINRYPFDTILMALNPAEVHLHSFQDKLLPRATGLGMGVIGMKVMARGMIFRAIPSAQMLLSYVLSLPVSTAIVGVMNESQLVRNARIASNFAPIPARAMYALEAATSDNSRYYNFYRKGGSNRYPGIETMPTSVL
jgi:aryl-alcohol dehydrogenase-like predicted oxidoreductase